MKIVTATFVQEKKYKGFLKFKILTLLLFDFYIKKIGWPGAIGVIIMTFDVIWHVRHQIMT